MNLDADSSQPHNPPPTGDAFFAWLRRAGIVRSSDRWFAGVAGGIASKAGIDPLLVRGAFVVLALLGGPGIVIYIVGWLLLPDASGRIHTEDIFRGRASSGLITAAVILAALVVLPLILRMIFGVGGIGIGFGAWDLWGVFGVPTWVATTFTVLFWIAIIVGVILWLRQIALDRGRAHRTAPDPGQGSPPDPGPPAQPAQTDRYNAPVEQTSAAFASPAAPTAAAASGEDPLAPPVPPPPAGTTDDANPGHTTAPTAPGTAPGADSGGTAGAWADTFTQQTDELSARYAERHDARRLGAGHTILTIAFALLAGGATALGSLALDPALSRSSFLAAPALAGLIAALVVCAVSLIIAGVRGRHTGWVGFLSTCGVLVLIAAIVVPAGARFQPLGNVTLGGVAEPASAFTLAGTTEITLTDDLAHTHEDEGIEAWLLAGNATVMLPETAPTVVELNLLAGAIRGDLGDDGQVRAAGPFITRTLTANLPPSGSTAGATHVTVNVAAGNVKVVENDADPAADRDSRSARERADLEAERERIQDELDAIEEEITP